MQEAIVFAAACSCLKTIGELGQRGAEQVFMLQGYFGDDCSNEAVHLQYGVPVDKEGANFE